MEFIKELRLKLLFLKFVKDPTKTDLIFRISDLGRDLKRNVALIAEIEQRILEDRVFKEAWDEKWIPATPSLEELAGYPLGSLGRAYFEHLEKNHLKINFFPAMKPTRVIDYLSYRLYHAHDLWHVLLGYPVTPQGEIEVQAFTLAQIKSPTSVMLMTGGFLNLLDKNPNLTPGIFESAVAAYHRGAASNFLLGLRLEEMLGESIERVSNKAGLAK